LVRDRRESLEVGGGGASNLPDTLEIRLAIRGARQLDDARLRVRARA
jgi:hypothetical protein